MRSGVCSVQQALTSEAVSKVKQAISLARRRGHAQVTPLHVATVMLASSGGLLRTACLKSHSHPLQCKALELCFNVALNRLPTSTSTSLLGPLHSSSHPSFSNALVAAFKRAQAHQRRGSIESQQQPILALKIEIEQLVISILDDPSVSRVMREAGFSSPQVKTNVEQSISMELFSQSPPVSCLSNPKGSNTINNPLVLGSTNLSHSSPPIQHGVMLAKPLTQVRNSDVMNVLDALMNKRKRNPVVLAESLASAEGVVRGVMDKFERGDVNGHLRFVQFISLPNLFSLKNNSKEQVEQKLAELRCLVRTYVARGIVLYLGDLKWVGEFWANCCEQKRNFYCPVEHMIMEIRRMLSGFGDGGRFWLMGIATFQAYTRCKSDRPSLESLWELHPLAIPIQNLGLSLKIDSDLQAQSKSKESENGYSWEPIETGVDKRLTFHTDWPVISFDKEARSTVKSVPNSESPTITTTSMSSKLPSWLQQYKEEKRRQSLNDEENVHAGNLCRKWGLAFSSIDKPPHFTDKTFNSSSSSTPTSTSISSPEQEKSNLHQTGLSWPVTFESKISPKEHQFWMYEKDGEGYMAAAKNEPKPDLLSNPNSSPNSATSSEAGEDTEENLPMFKELNAENLKVLCNALERKVPWQKEIVPEISSTVLQCRSGMTKRKGKSKQHYREGKEETWLFFLGRDSEGKVKIARELARTVFGSVTDFVSIGSSKFSSTRADSTDDLKNKRARDESDSSYFDRFSEALHENPHRVFFMEEVEQADYFSQMGIKRAIESGNVTLSSGELVPLNDAIVIFSCESISSMSRACSPPPPPPMKRKRVGSEDDEDNDYLAKSNFVSLDLNIATGADTATEEDSVSDIGILDFVDKQIIFKIQEL